MVHAAARLPSMHDGVGDHAGRPGSVMLMGPTYTSVTINVTVLHASSCRPVACPTNATWFNECAPDADCAPVV